MGMTPPRLNNVKKTALFLHDGFPNACAIACETMLILFLIILLFIIITSVGVCQAGQWSEAKIKDNGERPKLPVTLYLPSFSA